MQPDDHLFAEQANDVVAWSQTNNMSVEQFDELESKLISLTEHKINLGILAPAAAEALAMPAAPSSLVQVDDMDTDGESKSCHTTLNVAAPDRRLAATGHTHG